jgi:hypothetical protein
MPSRSRRQVVRTFFQGFQFIGKEGFQFIRKESGWPAGLVWRMPWRSRRQASFYFTSFRDFGYSGRGGVAFSFSGSSGCLEAGIAIGGEG